jgi:glutamyl-tRNA synthetase
MDLYNVKLTSAGGKAVGEYAGDEVIQDSRKFQWVTPAHEEVQVTVPDVLFLDGDAYNKDSLKEVYGFAEKYASELEVGSIVQFPRFGFARLDSPGRFILSG